jgi:hypothetical protein
LPLRQYDFCIPNSYSISGDDTLNVDGKTITTSVNADDEARLRRFLCDIFASTANEKLDLVAADPDSSFKDTDKGSSKPSGFSLADLRSRLKTIAQENIVHIEKHLKQRQTELTLLPGVGPGVRWVLMEKDEMEKSGKHQDLAAGQLPFEHRDVVGILGRILGSDGNNGDHDVNGASGRKIIENVDRPDDVIRWFKKDVLKSINWSVNEEQEEKARHEWPEVWTNSGMKADSGEGAEGDGSTSAATNSKSSPAKTTSSSKSSDSPNVINNNRNTSSLDHLSRDFVSAAAFELAAYDESVSCRAESSNRFFQELMKSKCPEKKIKFAPMKKLERVRVKKWDIVSEKYWKELLVGSEDGVAKKDVAKDEKGKVSSGKSELKKSKSNELKKPEPQSESMKESALSPFQLALRETKGECLLKPEVFKTEECVLNVSRNFSASRASGEIFDYSRCSVECENEEELLQYLQHLGIDTEGIGKGRSKAGNDAKKGVGVGNDAKKEGSTRGAGTQGKNNTRMNKTSTDKTSTGKTSKSTVTPTSRAEKFRIVRLKNTHHKQMKNSDIVGGYRDVKVLLLCENHIHEVQFILKAWIDAKKSMHCLYTVLR